VLLGAVIEQVSGEDYYDYVRKHIYAPAGMMHSESDSVGRHPENTAALFTRGGDPAARTGEPVETEHALGRGSPAGGGYSTVEDLLRFAQALRRFELLYRAHTEAIIGEPAGLGIAGGSPGVNALLELSGPYTLVVLANLDPPAAERLARTTGRMIRRAAGGDGPGLRREVRVGAGAH
jgi:CubicO group peptidase (beta-lactamase class C family)